MNENSIESNSLTVNLSIETLMKEIKHEVPEKHEFDNRDESILRATLSFRTIRILMDGFSKLMLQLKTLSQVEGFRLRP